jgi:4-diphosphocytidyl-2C-methyl-D-erythritol kinase
LALQPAGALLSGSGSTLFAVCRDRDEAERIARGMRSAGGNEFRVVVVQTEKRRQDSFFGIPGS